MQSTNSTLQFSEIPETQVFKFLEIHTKEAAKIKANEEKESAFNALKGSIVKVGKLLNLKKKMMILKFPILIASIKATGVLMLNA